MTLATRRLVLRPPRAEDAAPIARFLDNFAVSGNLARVPCPYRIEHARAWVESRRPDLPLEETNFAICLAGEGLIGQVGFHVDAGERTVIGYWLAQPFWNRGLMSEAAGAAIDWYFEASGAPVLHSGVFAFNRASLAIQKKLGFVQTGTSSMHCLARGEDLRHIDTELTRAAWAERRR
jgi:RimJ/RimL family protein N-acetyltransferase